MARQDRFGISEKILSPQDSLRQETGPLNEADWQSEAKSPRTHCKVPVVMALIPRWQYMTDSSKAMVRRSAITLVVVLIGLTLLRAIFPWILLGLAIYGAWCLLNRK